MQWDHMGPVSVVKFTKCSPISTPKNKGFKTFQVKHCHLTRTGPVTHRLMPQIQSHHISPHLAVHQTSKQISADQSRPFKSLQVLQYIFQKESKRHPKTIKDPPSICSENDWDNWDVSWVPWAGRCGPHLVEGLKGRILDTKWLDVNFTNFAMWFNVDSLCFVWCVTAFLPIGASAGAQPLLGCESHEMNEMTAGTRRCSQVQIPGFLD